MRRVHLVELHELPWFPEVWRDLLTDVMSYFAEGFRPYRAVGERLWGAMQECGATSIVDLCSGAGKAALTAAEEIGAHHHVEVPVALTDKYPNLPAFRQAVQQAPGRVTVVDRPVDATDVPGDLGGFWTMFTSFHHFREPEARRILANAVRRRRGIGVFEYTERNLLVWGPAILAMPLFVWLATPFIRPFSWRRVLWTNLLPVVPFLAAWDGLVSCLRTYSPEELLALTPEPTPAGYRWEAGRLPSLGGCRITYLLGWPTST
jgi:SAM-dependent methyltransferase